MSKEKDISKDSEACKNASLDVIESQKERSRPLIKLKFQCSKCGHRLEGAPSGIQTHRALYCAVCVDKLYSGYCGEIQLVDEFRD